MDHFHRDRMQAGDPVGNPRIGERNASDDLLYPLQLLRSSGGVCNRHDLDPGVVGPVPVLPMAQVIFIGRFDTQSGRLAFRAMVGYSADDLKHGERRVENSRIKKG